MDRIVKKIAGELIGLEAITASRKVHFVDSITSGPKIDKNSKLKLLLSKSNHTIRNSVTSVAWNGQIKKIRLDSRREQKIEEFHGSKDQE